MRTLFAVLSLVKTLYEHTKHKIILQIDPYKQTEKYYRFKIPYHSTFTHSIKTGKYTIRFYYNFTISFFICVQSKQHC
jgi:hypothetical protein